MATLGDFPVSDRFEKIRLIGEGSFGRVYEAFDRERQTSVAMKVLCEEAVGENVLRFKNEFRGLTELRHTNIVKLYELLNEGGQWFFTMELLPNARPLTSWVRPTDAPWEMSFDHGTGPIPAHSARLSELTSELTSTQPVAPRGTTGVAPAPQRISVALPPLDLQRLREALAQLAAGVHAIHQHNKLHRDIKPNNVLVTPDGRVVLVDFGLATAPGETHQFGTPAYMAPEQCLDSRPAEAADWYSVGVMLYEALTGQVPFNGLEESVERVLELKVTQDPPPPRALDPSLPADLDELCVGLLQRDPSHRLRELEILRRLQVAVGHEHKRLDAPSAQNNLFVGRAEELATLERAYGDARAEQVKLLVTGESGVGKSALVRHWVPSLAERGATVLVGRCYEQESVPYKAWDGVIDHLSDFITQLGNAVAADLVPANASLLVNAFPVLRRVEAFVRAPALDVQHLQPHERRARVFAALRDLFARVAQRAPLVVFVDDLQWADQDSIDLLSTLTQGPDAPALLLVATVRDIADPQMAAQIKERLGRIGEARTLRIQPLPASDATELARRLATDAGLDATLLASEAGGHPMFIEELVRYAQSGAALDDKPRLEQALASRIAQLAPAARRVVEILGVAGRPLSREIGARALQMEVAELVAHIDTLQANKMVRTDGTRRTDKIEPYHDRVREAALTALGEDDKRACHERLALAFETSDAADPEALAIHWHGAGNARKGARFAAQAATQAFDALAFDRAARLFRQALNLWPDNPDGLKLWSQLAEALVNSGHGAAAAEVLTHAAQLAEPSVAVGLRQRAAEQLLRSGHIDQGWERLASVLAEYSLAMPESRRGAIAALLRARAVLWIGRKTETQLDDRPTSTDPTMRKRLELCWSTMQGLLMVDQLMGALYHSRHLRLARLVADPVALARGLCVEAINLTANGKPSATIAETLRRAEELVNRVRQPYTNALLHFARGSVALLSGSFSVAIDECRLAEKGFREECVGTTWEVDSAQQNIRWALCYSGRLTELDQDVSSGMRDARERNDLFAAMNALSGFPNLVWLVRGDVDGARRETREAIAQWSQKGFFLQHAFDLFAQTQIDIYLGDGVAAYDRLMERWKDIESSGLLRVQLNRVMMRELRARAALAKARSLGETGEPFKREAKRIAKQLRGEGRPWTEAFAELLDAQTADPAEQNARLAAAAAKLDAADMKLYAKAARAAMTAEARREIETELGARGVASPTALLRLFTPVL